MRVGDDIYVASGVIRAPGRLAASKTDIWRQIS